MKNAVLYKGVWLMKNSKAYELYHEMQKDPKVKSKLDKLMKEVDEVYRKTHYG